MSTFDESFNSTLNEAMEDMFDEGLNPALEALSEMAFISDSKELLTACLEQLSDSECLVASLEAEQTYKTWRDENASFVSGSADTGPELQAELKDVISRLSDPSMESSLFQKLKRSYRSMSNALKSRGRNLQTMRDEIRGSKVELEKNPVLLTAPKIYRFFTRDNKRVKSFSKALNDDMVFLKKCEEHYDKLQERAIELGNVFRKAVESEHVGDMRDTIDRLDRNILNRDELYELTKFNLIGNRRMILDKRGFPKFKFIGDPWEVSQKKDNKRNVIRLLSSKDIHGFSVGGLPKNIKGLSSEEISAISDQVSKTGGEHSVDEMVKLVDKAVQLNQMSIKFAQMAKMMAERVDRLSDDMHDAYNRVHSGNDAGENLAHLREIRSLYKAARRSVSQYMFLGKALATAMEDHSNYIYRIVREMSSSVVGAT